MLCVHAGSSLCTPPCLGAAASAGTSPLWWYPAISAAGTREQWNNRGNKRSISGPCECGKQPKECVVERLQRRRELELFPAFKRHNRWTNCGNKDGNIILVLKMVFPPLLQQLWSVWNDWTHMYKSLVFGTSHFAPGPKVTSGLCLYIGLLVAPATNTVKVMLGSGCCAVGCVSCTYIYLWRPTISKLSQRLCWINMMHV